MNLPQAFKPGPWAVAMSFVIVALFAGFAYLSYTDNAPYWQIGFLSGVAVLGIVGIVDVLTTRVELTEDQLVVTSNLRTQTYRRSAFVQVTAERGVPIALKTTEGTWVKLPSVSPGGMALVNKLRAWVKKDGAKRIGPDELIS